MSLLELGDVHHPDTAVPTNMKRVLLVYSSLIENEQEFIDHILKKAKQLVQIYFITETDRTSVLLDAGYKWHVTDSKAFLFKGELPTIIRLPRKAWWTKVINRFELTEIRVMLTRRTPTKPKLMLEYSPISVPDPVPEPIEEPVKPVMTEKLYKLEKIYIRETPHYYSLLWFLVLILIFRECHRIVS